MTRNTEIIICYLTSEHEPVTSNWVSSQLIPDIKNDYKIRIIKINKYSDNYSTKSNFSICNEIINQIDKIKFTHKNIVFFTMLFDKYLTNDLFDYLDRKSIISVNYLVDSITIPYKYYKFSNKFTYIAVPFVESLNFFNSKGINNVIYFPYGTSSTLMKYSTENKFNSISFVGSNYGVRPYYIDFLLKNNILVNVRGNHWKKIINKSDIIDNNWFSFNSKLVYDLLQFKNGRKILLSKLLKYKLNTSFDFNFDKILNDEDVYNFIASYNISLGFSEYGSTHFLKNPILHYRMRDLECPMLGVCHITNKSEDLKYLFNENEEIIFYNSMFELKDKILFYSKNIDIAKNIGKNAQIKSILSNRWLNRFDNFILKYVNYEYHN
jgi:hypothetical protein